MPAKTKNLEKISFEEALKKLEGIVGSMEEGEVPLAELVDQFEEGSKFLKICQKRLQDAALKIEKLKDDQDDLSFEPFDSEASNA